MLSLTDLFFWLYFALFFAAIFFAFFVPGDILLRKISLSSLQRIVLATIIETVLWGWQGFIFGYLSFRCLSYFYLGIFFIAWIMVFFKKHSFNFSIKLTLNNFDWDNIRYLYLFYPYGLKATEAAVFTEKAYKNNKITILKVLPDAIDLYLKNNLKQDYEKSF